MPTEKPKTSSGSKPPVKVGIGLDKKRACCPSNAQCAVGEPCRKIVATGTATRGKEIATDVQVTVSGPGGSMAVGNGTAVLTYTIRDEDCGTSIEFVAKAGDKEAKETADVIKIEFNGMGDPHRIGITTEIGGTKHDRTQHLSASVSPKAYAGEAAVSVGPRLELSNVVRNSTTGEVKFDLVGVVPGSATKGDTWVRVTAKECVATRKISVVYPKSIGKPFANGAFKVAPKNMALSRTTVPAYWSVPNATTPPNAVIGATVWGTSIDVVVKDQFGDSLEHLYDGADISEDAGGQSNPLNVKLNNSSYPDFISIMQTLASANLPNSPIIINFLAGPTLRPPADAVDAANVPVQVDGFQLNPAVVERITRWISPDKIEIQWGQE